VSTVGIVAVSIIIGFFLALITGLTAYLAFEGYRTRRTLLRVESQTPLLIAEYRTTLTEQIGLLNAKISHIRGEELQRASGTILQSAKRIEIACVAFGELARSLLSEETLGLERVKKSGLAPEDYAAETGERHVTLNRTAIGDRADLADESGEGAE